VLGAWLRWNPGKENAERASRFLHFLFWFGTFPPEVFGIFSPGLSGFDQELGLSSLPGQPLVRILGIVALLLGAHLIFVSNIALFYLGQGAHAFWLTTRLVVSSIYERMRNPMSLGRYLGSVGLGLLAGGPRHSPGRPIGMHAQYARANSKNPLAPLA
jgi:hypothetical protein